MDNYEEKYKKALSWMQGLYKGLHGKTKEEAEEAFPELKETPKDETIKKALLRWFENCEHVYFAGVDTSDIIAWLREQLEMPIGKDLQFEIDNLSKRYPEVSFAKLSRIAVHIANWQKQQIAKDNMLLPFKEYDNLMDSINRRKKEGYEAGYKQGLVDSKDEHKPADTEKGAKGNEREIPNSAWSEEDEEIYRKCICAMRASACGFPEEEKFVEQVDNWLKSLKDRVQPKQEWSEEDVSHIRYLIECLEHCKKGVALTMTTSTSQEYINWLKSLKPQPTWKPSEEQMDALDNFIYAKYLNVEKHEAAVKSLYQDLKKLRGE